VIVPDLFPTEATTDTANFVTWETGTEGDPAVRFLVPVNVYVPGETEATPPPADYLTYLLGQSKDGATFSDQSETTVDGRPATLVTATVEDSLDGSLGCPTEDVAADECFGLQPDLTSGWPSSTWATRPFSPGYAMPAPRKPEMRQRSSRPSKTCSRRSHSAIRAR
jgi:hypothetical protein